MIYGDFATSLLYAKVKWWQFKLRLGAMLMLVYVRLPLNAKLRLLWFAKLVLGSLCKAGENLKRVGL